MVKPSGKSIKLMAPAVISKSAVCGERKVTISAIPGRTGQGSCNVAPHGAGQAVQFRNDDGFNQTENTVARLADVVYAAHIGMRDLAGEADFFVKAR